MLIPRRFQADAINIGGSAQPDRGVLLSLLINQLITIPIEGERRPLSYAGRPYLQQLVDSFLTHPKFLFVWGRQTEKSTALSSIHLSTADLFGLTWQYVSATMQQAKEYSTWKIDGAIRDSPILAGFYDQSGRRRPYNIKMKESFLGSRILIGTAYGDAARIRGNPADGASVDEISLVDSDTIGVILECLSHSKKFAWELHAGTPLSTDNPQWVMWNSDSVQHEWGIPCGHHTPQHWNILEPEHVTPDGIICRRCGNPLDTQQGKWVKTVDPPGAKYWAFRLPQAATPFANHAEICSRLIARPVVTLRESFAFAVEEAQEVFSAMFLEQALCRSGLMAGEDQIRAFCSLYPAYGGLDWALGGAAATVLVLGGYDNEDKFRFAGGFRFKGDPETDLQQIISILQACKVHGIVADEGAGQQRNRTLMRLFGFPKFLTCMYARQEERILLHPKSCRLRVDRNHCLDDFSVALRMRPRQWVLPDRAEMERVHWWQDMRAVLVESDHLGRPQFIKRAGETDDFFHGMFYCFLAAHMRRARPDVLSPVIMRFDEGDAWGKRGEEEQQQYSPLDLEHDDDRWI